MTTSTLATYPLTWKVEMDWGWTNALSPIVILLGGWWIKRSAESRTQRLLADSAAARETARASALGAEALARENLREAIETHQRLRDVESNVNGRLSRQINIVETAQTDAAQIRQQLSMLHVLVAEMLERRPGAVADVKEAIAIPIPSPTEPPPPLQTIPGGTEVKDA